MKRLDPSHAPRTPPSELHTLFRRVANLVHSLSVSVCEKTASADQFSEAENALAGLPLGADEYSVVQCRLRNALRYFRIGEWGASNFELRLLARSLKN
jgi:hypothetical protein